ncbi:MAG: restriction endonuclease, partial [bacterium]
AMDLAQRDFPIEVELKSLSELRGWVHRLITATAPPTTRIASLVLELSRALAREVAADPRALDEIEWRQLELMLGAVFDELGFDAEVTPSAKDGGKDLILRVSDRQDSAIWAVEIKHWRSGQRVGKGKVRDFVEVIARDGYEGGLFLATHGYTQDAFRALSEVERTRLRVGTEEKVLSLCRTFVKAERGLWSPASDDAVAQLLVDATLTPPVAGTWQ